MLKIGGACVNNQNEEREVIHSMYTKTTFVKIKQVLDIDKVLFSFVDSQNKINIDCYMSAVEFGALLMQDVKNGSLYRNIVNEKAKGEQYPKEVWTSPMGGSNKNGKMVSRHFTIAPGSRQEVVITAKQYPATQSDTGAYIPVKGSQAAVIRVGCTYNDLRMLQYKWSYLEHDYMTIKYNMDAMRSTYVRGQQNSGFNNDITITQDPPSEQTYGNSSFTVKLENDGQIVSNGMKMFAISVGDSAGKLYVRPEDFDKIPASRGDISINAEKKGDNYLFLAS